MRLQTRSAVLLIISLLTAPGMGRDIYVSLDGTNNPPYTNWPDAATNIQWAVNAGTNGDTVWVSNGVYVLTNQITVRSNITICGTGGVAVISGNNSNRCFEFLQAATGALVNLFITQGYTNAYGGGVYMRSGEVRDCIFSNNTSAGNFRGGGLYFDMSSFNCAGLIRRCTFVENKADKGGGAFLFWASPLQVDSCLFYTNIAFADGGGLYVSSCRNTVITGCDFICNVASNKYGGVFVEKGTNNIISACTISSNISFLDCGGISLADYWVISNSVVSYNTARTNYTGGIDANSTSQVRNCVVAYNSALSSSGSHGGGGIQLEGGASVQDCVIEGNWAGYMGGGFSFGSGTKFIRNCLIRNNYAGNRGGGMVFDSGGILLQNCTIVSNYAGIAGGGGINNTIGPAGAIENCVIYFNESALAAYSNFIFTSAASSYSNNCTAPAITTGIITNNIIADPQFIDWGSGNYRLSRNSPCINTGVNRAWMTDAVDLDSHHRMDKFSGQVDMGCYEYLPSGIVFSVR